MINNSKLIYLLSFMLLITISCEDDAGVDCDAAKTTFTAAVNAVGDDGPADEAECQGVVDAAGVFLDTGCDTAGTDVGMYNTFNCGCVTLASAFEEAGNAFAAGMQSGTGTVEDCQAYVDAMVALVDAGCMSAADLGLDQAQYDEYTSGTFCTDLYDAGISTPSTFNFDSRFVDGVSSVSYNGQVVRNLLINDIKGQFKGGNGAKVLSMMANDDATATIITTAGGSTVQTFYHDISTSHLNDRLEAVSSYVIPGWDVNAGTLLGNWATELGTLDMDATTNAQGLRLDQLAQKTLWGAVAYWQGTSKYMSKIPNDDNTMQDDGDPYTAMEHHWDESFGYFGAARDYNTGYTDDNDRKSDPYHDTNGDGSIDFKTEYNIGWAVTAAKRDLVDGVSIDYDFTKTIFDAYLEGRTLIVNEAPLEEIIVQRDIILNTWEKVVAAVTIHYVNDVAADMAALYPADATAGPSSELSADLNNHWGEMRGYANGLLYNDFKVISDADLNTVLTTMGTAPVYPEAGEDAFYTYHGLLLTTVKNTLQAAYDFSDEHMANW
ncbi:MAG: hypothetical protein CMG55_10125 [Candidatus Marinimicrobia bacterium]|nr:hypothetical protein [Candidatus Neomarinimicrobiota bacterium]